MSPDNQDNQADSRGQWRKRRGGTLYDVSLHSKLDNHWRRNKHKLQYMTIKCRIPSIKNWSSETNRQLSLRLMTLAKHKPMLYTEFKQLEAERIAKLVFIGNGNKKKAVAALRPKPSQTLAKTTIRYEL